VIEGDLAAIREYEPFMETVYSWPHWNASSLILELTQSAYDEFIAGTYTGLDSLNAIYGPVNMSDFWWPGHTCVELNFIDACYNAPILRDIYLEHPDVIGGSVGGFVGEGDDIWADGIGRCTFTAGWEDCASGCVYRHRWLFEVNGGLVNVLDEWGDPLDDWPTDLPEIELESLSFEALKRRY